MDVNNSLDKPNENLLKFVVVAHNWLDRSNIILCQHDAVGLQGFCSVL